MAVSDKELVNYKKKILSAIQNKMFVPLPLMEDKELDYTQKKELLQYGEYIAGSISMPRWKTYFGKELKTLVSAINNDLDILHNKSTTKEKIDALTRLTSQGLDYKNADRNYVSDIVSLLTSTKNAKDSERMFNALNLKTTEEFNEFYHKIASTISSNIRSTYVYKDAKKFADSLNNLFEKMKMSKSEWSNITKDLLLDTADQEITFALLDKLKNRVGLIPKEIVSDCINAELLNYSYDFSQFSDSLERLYKLKDYIKFDRKQTESLISSAIYQSLELSDVGIGGYKRDIDKIWTAVEKLTPLLDHTAAVKAINNYIFEDKLYYAKTMVPHLTRLFPESKLTVYLDQCFISNREMSNFRSMLLANWANLSNETKKEMDRTRDIKNQTGEFELNY